LHLGVLRLYGAEKHYFHLCSHEEKIPSCGMDLAIKTKAIERLDYSPVS